MNPYLDRNSTLTGAASDQELGRQAREGMAVKAAHDQGYDRGRVESERGLAKMLYNSVFGPQGNPRVQPQEPTLQGMQKITNVNSTSPLNTEYDGLSRSLLNMGR